MKISDAGLALVKDSEGFSSVAYPDPATRGEPWTIGYGHTGGVKRGDTVTPDEAEDILRNDLQVAEWAVMKLVHVAMSQGQFDALVDFVFNLGEGALAGSTLLRKLNAGDYAGAAAEFPKWVHAGNQTLPGLVTRRERERAMFEENA